ncbi:hypothetical protein [cf. Phormidesmis sp. LEGE 11477]|uniref:hypothetical protein n=1 Tax=cf. Phormidesmis sp. LEGE 11477 TaxID=1828680 RepID=UPI001881B987|nr:hypothetical protein [cf. Phormidesmis sp. LEGE 11477]MBE9063576.1 hypothetical protein [cf. Phormidesmis sp. LEGE 11477]
MQSSNPYLHQPPRLVSDTHYCVVGDVTVDSTAAIAPGVVLQAPSGSRIVIEKGACLAGGVCLQSRQGVLTISAGTSLGANVLVIGHGTIGKNACISPSTTLINPQIEPDALVPPGAVIDQTASAQAAFVQTAGQYASQSYGASQSQYGQSEYGANGTQSPTDDDFVNTFVEPPPVGPKPIETPDLSDQNGQYQESAATQNGYGRLTNDVQLNNSSTNGGGSSSSGIGQNGSSSLAIQSNGSVYGREQVSQLISTLFPNRQPSKGS